jgi:uncharacterized membrane protein YhiD involved in acid resistance
MDENSYIILGIAAIIVIAIGILFSKNFRARLNRKGFEVDKTQTRDDVVVRKVRNKSKVRATTKSGQNLTINDIDNSNIDIT